MSDQQEGARQKTTVFEDGSPLQQLLRLVAREVVRRLKIEQSRSKQPPKDENQ